MAPSLRILMLNNRYGELGGEEISVRQEAELLSARGHRVDLWEMSNDELQSQNSVSTAIGAIWSRAAAIELANRLRASRHDLVHVQNYFPRFSPAVHRVAARHRVASIQHLRNYRFTCANAQLFREGAECHECLGRSFSWGGVAHACYRGSRAASAAVAASITTHRLLGTWRNSVTRYIGTSKHVRDIHVQAGIPAEKISVRANLAIPPNAVDGPRRGVFLASRLSPEKGIDVLLHAWRMRARSEVLEIAGAGSCEADLRALAEGDPTIRFLGRLPHSEVLARMAGARLVVVCALWQEPFGRAALEAMSAGTPVIASAVGGLAEILDRLPQCLVPPGDAEALDFSITKLLSDGEAWRMTSDALRRRFASRYAAEAWTSETEAIYRMAIAESAAARAF